MKTPEAVEKDEICNFLKSIGAWYVRAYQAGYGKSGIADIVGCYKGRFFAIEVKRHGALPTPAQEQRMREVYLAGGFATWGTAGKAISEMKKWIETLLVAFFLVHSWYPWSCCGERDCHEIPCDSVTETRTGYMVDGVFFATAQPSPDKHCHACVTAARKGTCLYIQLST